MNSRIKHIFLTLSAVAVCWLCVLSPRIYAWSLFGEKELLEVTILDPFAEMRTGPGRGYPIFHVIEKNDTITILKSKTTWYKVRTKDNKLGWISRDTLENTLGPDKDSIKFVQPGWEDYMARRWEFGVTGGAISGSTSIGLFGGYHFTHNISTELRYTESFGDISSARLATLNIVNRPFPRWLVSPFFTLGAGVYQVSPRSNLVQSVDRTDNLLSVGTGLTYYATSRLVMRFEYNKYTALTTRENNEEVEEWKAGFSVFF